jgi:Domain of unknown function (DUF5591)
MLQLECTRDLILGIETTEYSTLYDFYMKFFHRIARTRGEVYVKSPPVSWIPLLEYLRVNVASPECYFPVDLTCAKLGFGSPNLWLHANRTVYEALCSFRPECIDALYKLDSGIWSRYRVRTLKEHKDFRADFTVTTNAGFHRPEVLAYLELLHKYKPTKNKVILLPCSADKPYPSLLHKKVIEILPNDYYIMNVTGTLGLVPQHLWPKMPLYDAGLPNHWRVFEETKFYFDSFAHKDVLIYVDFYGEVLDAYFSVEAHNNNYRFVILPEKRDDYLLLESAPYIESLRRMLADPSDFRGHGLDKRFPK